MNKKESFEIRCKPCGKRVLADSKSYSRALWLIYSHAKSHKVYELYPEKKPSSMNEEFLNRMVEIKKKEVDDFGRRKG
jgi:hypothetical protein